MQRTIGAMIGSVLLVMVLLLQLSRTGSGPAPAEGSTRDSEPLMMYCAASNRAVIEQVAEAYQQEFGRSVQVQFGASQAMLSALAISGTGDLFLPADDSYIDIAEQQGLVGEVIPLATMQVGLAVRRGNPRDIHEFTDLIRADVRLVQANPDVAAVAKITRSVLTEAGHWESLDRATTAYKTSVTDAANDVLVGAADVAIVFDALLHDYPALDFVRVAPLRGARAQISIGVLSSSEHPAAAIHFARYIAAPDRGGKSYREHGFSPPTAATWSEHTPSARARQHD